MATQTVMDPNEKIDTRIMFALAITDLMGVAEPAHLANDTLANAAMAVGELLREIEDVREEIRLATKVAA